MTALSEAKVALVMGSAFGAEGYARLSFATDLQTLERGSTRSIASCATDSLPPRDP